jgi:hypothetical protein
MNLPRRSQGQAVSNESGILGTVGTIFAINRLTSAAAAVRLPSVNAFSSDGCMTQRIAMINLISLIIIIAGIIIGDDDRGLVMA